ncbi:MAG: 50S ribosomal protein L24 [Eggerthellaceae bacterium]|nr:50S ribosomal protein L24 [Eggerthellaceae bacterium]MDR2716042.1 50S ribosomal protein L24 [Coriobacteriaceae bacterium]
MNIKKDDKVKILAGKDKGKESVVLRAYPETQRVIVERVNVVKKTLRPTQKNPQGGISTIEAPIHVSNVAVVCPSCKKATRIAIQRSEDNKKVRFCKKCSKAID